jgi:hypothetical protein
MSTTIKYYTNAFQVRISLDAADAPSRRDMLAPCGPVLPEMSVK